MAGDTRHISIAHYYEQNGDQCPDPELLLTDTGLPISMSGGYYQEALSMRDGVAYINRTIARDIVAFAAIWARNLCAQGFVKAAKVAKVKVPAVL